MADEWWQSAPVIEEDDQWWQSAPTVEPLPAGQRFVQGVKDVSLGTEQLAAHAAGSLGLTDTWAPAVDKRIAELEDQYRAPEGTDWARLGGNVVGALPTAIIPGGPLVAGAVGGALGGATSPVTSGAEDFWTEKAKQAGLGALTGGATGGALGLAGKIIAPKVSPQVRLLAAEGVTPTPGQILGGAWKTTEDKLTSVPILGDMIISGQSAAVRSFNKAAYARALAPIGETVKGVGRDAVGEVRDKLGAAYDELLPKLSFRADPQFEADMQQITREALLGLPEPQSRQFMTTLQNKMLGKMGPAGELDGKTYQGVDSELRRLADGYQSDASFDQRELGSYLHRALTASRTALARGNPKEAARLTDINRGFSQYARIREAASSAGARDGVFTPAMLDRAVRGADKSSGRGAYASGQAPGQEFTAAGKEALSQAYPDSGTAGRAVYNSLFASGVGGAAVMMSPWALGPLLGGVPYLPGARKLTAAALMKRPPGARAARAALSRTAAPLGFASGGLIE